MKRGPKLLIGAVVGYVALVVFLETFVGLVQFEARQGLRITTIDANGEPRDRELGRFETEDAVYVSAHHWPRAWYGEAVARPRVEVTIAGKRGPYRAVPIEDADEHARLVETFPLPWAFRFVTGFAPRSFLRLDPVTEAP